MTTYFNNLPGNLQPKLSMTRLCHHHKEHGTTKLHETVSKIFMVDFRKLGLFIFAHCHFGKCTRLTLTCRVGNSSKSPHWLRCWLFLGGGGQKFSSKILERVRNFAQKIWGWRKFCAKIIGGRYLCKNSWGSRIYILAKIERKNGGGVKTVKKKLEELH